MNRTLPRTPMAYRASGALACLVLAGCFSPDPPLLATELPNGYSYHSNGGTHGYIRKHPGMLRDFGIQDDGSECWCNEFGWQADLVICRMTDEANPQRIRELDYFILDTRTGNSWLAANQLAAQRRLQQLGTPRLPDLASRFWSTRRR